MQLLKVEKFLLTTEKLHITESKAFTDNSIKISFINLILCINHYFWQSIVQWQQQQCKKCNLNRFRYQYADEQWSSVDCDEIKNKKYHEWKSWGETNFFCRHGCFMFLHNKMWEVCCIYPIKKTSHFCEVCGSSRVRTADPLLVRQML